MVKFFFYTNLGVWREVGTQFYVVRPIEMPYKMEWYVFEKNQFEQFSTIKFQRKYTEND